MQNDKNEIVKSLNVDRVDITEEKENADNLNTYFCTEGKELAKKFSTNNSVNYLKY